MEYVAIPEGSSSAAPVMTPGPSAAAMRRSEETLRGPLAFLSVNFVILGLTQIPSSITHDF